MDKLTSPKTIEGLLRRYDLHFNKRYGQNFLIDANVVEKIVAAGQITKEDVVVEVGPGIGTMTQVLASQAHRVYTVEIDKKLIPVLGETLADYPNVTVVEGDILKTDVSALVKEDLLAGKHLKVVANLPYYVTTPIIMGFLEGDLPLESMTVMIQKEAKAYGSLTIAAQYYADVALAFYVPATVFMPKPKVDSVVITLKKKEGPAQVPRDKALFFKVVRAAFINRRKTLINSLANNTEYGKELWLEAMEKADIEPSIRGERLTGEDYVRLSDCLSNLK